MNSILLRSVPYGIFCSTLLVARQELPAFDTFAQRYAPPPYAIALIEKHKELVLNIKKRGVLKELPQFFIKVADAAHGASKLIHRVVNAERLRRCIRHHNLHCLEVVKKYLYRVTGIWLSKKTGAVRLDGKWIVLAEKIDFTPQKLHLSREELQQLAILAETALYRDWGVARAIDGGERYAGNNWVRNIKTGKLTCIDTEDRSFEAGTGVNISGCTVKVILDYLSDELLQDCKCRFRARRWLRKRKKKMGAIVLGKSLNHSTEYDDPDLNFEQVKREWTIEYEQFTREQKDARIAGRPPSLPLPSPSQERRN